ncbi:hypothetical protein ACQP2Y_32540 [Actinoplanes sp. CA-051413]|uniref:hypothetical protein n=1 Tax=Actinoplanes sp. CA-051413 TaxID=3239899 RepID=UPI003D962814
MNRRGFLTVAAGVPLAAAGVTASPAFAAAAPAVSTATPAANPALGTAAGAASGAAPLRGRVTGLLVRDPMLIRDASAARLRGFVQPLTWAEAQPEPGGDLSSQALTKLQAAADLARQRGYSRLKLRLLAGWQSPGWALALGGGPMREWEDPDAVEPDLYDVPVWWADDFLAAYSAFLPKLAAALEDEPLWGEVTVSGTCTVFAEPCVKQLGVAANRKQALDREYTAAADRAALETVIAAHHDTFSPMGITSSVAYNPWQFIAASGRMETDPAVTVQLMDHQRATMGAFGVWENNSLIARRTGGVLEQTRPDYQGMYDHMIAGAAAGHPIQFQTATLAKIQAAGGTAEATASWVAENGGISVELPRGWEQDTDAIGVNRADQLNRQLAVNAAATLG